MGKYQVDSVSQPGILILRLEGTMSTPELSQFVAEHNGAIEALHGAPYRVFCDLTKMSPLSPEGAALFQQAKEFSAKQASFRGSAVWVASSLVTIQHRRTSVDGGVMDSELISDNEQACWEHLRRVHRSRPKLR